MKMLTHVDTSSESSIVDPSLTIFSISHSHDSLQTSELEINGVPISLVIDTGAKVSLLNEATYIKNFGRHVLQPANDTVVL